MNSARLDEMEQYVLGQGTVSMAGLCGRFGISVNTARRDIARMLQRGTVEKVYGGVRARHSEQLTAFAIRAQANLAAKTRIAMAAAARVEDGDFIFVDSGSTTMHLARYIPQGYRVTLLTYSLQCINNALAHPGIQVLALPGQLQRETSSMTGMETLTSLRKYHIRKAFMAASAVSLTDGVMNSSPLEYEIKRNALAQSDAKYLLVNHDKFDRTAMLTYARAEDFTALVTEAMPAEAYRRFCREHGVEIIVGEG